MIDPCDLKHDRSSSDGGGEATDYIWNRVNYHPSLLLITRTLRSIQKQKKNGTNLSLSIYIDRQRVCEPCNPVPYIMHYSELANTHNVTDTIYIDVSITLAIHQPTIFWICHQNKIKRTWESLIGSHNKTHWVLNVNIIRKEEKKNSFEERLRRKKALCGDHLVGV